jgi:hypothetical protein
MYSLNNLGLKEAPLVVELSESWVEIESRETGVSGRVNIELRGSLTRNRLQGYGSV